MAHVLVVDDDLTILHVAKAILERSGFKTLSADCGRDALAVLQAHDIDLLLTDILMPGMSGGELIEEARRQYPDLPVCCMTAYLPLVDRHLKRLFIIPKPFRSRELVNAIQNVLKARPQRRDHVGAPCSGSRPTPGDQIHEPQTLLR